MAHLGVFVAALAVIVCGAAAAVRVAWRRRSAGPLTQEPPRESRLVRLLTSDEELHDAVARAARFEQMMADTHSTRVRRYEAMVSPLRAPAIGPGRRFPAGEGDRDGARSA